MPRVSWKDPVSVYVDWLFNHGWVLRGRRIRSCHMFADSLDELHAMACKVGLKRAWFQLGSAPHYDLTESRRRSAVRYGAVELTRATFREAYARAKSAT